MPSGSFAYVPSAQARRWLRQRLVGLLMLPITLLPFLGYFWFTQEGALIWERVEVAVRPPRLPQPSVDDLAWLGDHTPRYHDAVALLVYHGIGRGADESTFSISPERFADQLAMLKAAGMHAVTAREVGAAMEGDAQLPSNAVMISFDDGRSDAMMFADPLLEEAGMRATMFVIADAASDPGIYYVSWESLQAYAASGRWDLESHTSSSHHLWAVADGRELPMLTSLAQSETVAAYRRRVNADLQRADGGIGTHIGDSPTAFAYPFGAYGGRYDDRTNSDALAPILREAVASHYDVAFNQDDQSTWGLATCADDPLGLRRLEVGDWSGRELIARIAEAATALQLPACAQSPS